jgi:hypothetical protein
VKKFKRLRKELSKKKLFLKQKNQRQKLKQKQPEKKHRPALLQKTASRSSSFLFRFTMPRLLKSLPTCKRQLPLQKKPLHF